MKRTLLILATLLPVLAPAQQENDPYLSLRLEMEHAIRKGNEFLERQQHAEGYWDDPKTPALTALALTGIMRAPEREPDAEEPAWVTKAYDWLLANQKEDGGIYAEGNASYNTATAIMALVARGREADQAAILKARAYLVSIQTDWGTKGEVDNPVDGGIGYGSSRPHSDMSNTLFALEALHYTRQLAKDSGAGEQPELDWEAARTFITRCQNLTATNDQEWASDDPANKGGFIYFPGDSKAGEQELGDGRTALRSYGSISYAGLLSLLYAELEKDDPRVKAVLDWLGENYTLEENPGMGQQGLYYYFHSMAKALAAAGVEKLPTGDGKTADWRRSLGAELVSTQKPDGSWINDTARWMENNPVLVTSYVVMALEQIVYTFPNR